MSLEEEAAGEGDEEELGKEEVEPGHGGSHRTHLQDEVIGRSLPAVEYNGNECEEDDARHEKPEDVDEKRPADYEKDDKQDGRYPDALLLFIFNGGFKETNNEQGYGEHCEYDGYDPGKERTEPFEGPGRDQKVGAYADNDSRR